jgi:subtilisin family serine protease
MIDLPEAWKITTGSAGAVVAVIDNGIRFDHPGIALNLTSDGRDFVSDNSSLELCSGGSVGSAGDGDGYDGNPTIPADYEIDQGAGCITGLQAMGGHGLHVAGTIGAVGNDGLGVSGVNWSVRIRPVRAFGVYGAAEDYDIAQAILYAAGLPADDGAGGLVQITPGAKVINMSFGGSGAAVVRNAVLAAADAGALLIAAAGNESSSSPSYPAAYPEVLSVSSVGPSRDLASYSNFGSTVDIAAPGGDITNGDPTLGVYSTLWNFVTGTPTYGAFQGTSMASPHVAGVAALILANNPGLTASELRSRLTDFAVDAGAPGRDNLYGAGIVNAWNSLTQSLGPTRQLRARLYDALTGSIVQTVAAPGGSYSFSNVTGGSYEVFAGQDENGDGEIGVPGRRWGAFGGAASPSTITVTGSGSHQASFSVGRPSEQEPNETLANADVLPVGGYLLGKMTPTDLDGYRVLIPQPGQYTFETSPVDGACGFALEEDTVIGLYDAQGNLITSNDDIDKNAGNFCSRITATLTPGTYHIGVQGYNGGTYRVQARVGP